MTKRLRDQLRHLHDLKEHVKAGRYREVFRSYLKHQELDSPSRHFSSTTDARIRLEYAIGLQHAGIFEIALKTYQNIADEMLTAKKVRRDDAITREDIIYNANVQQAVLLQRLGQPRKALGILEEIGSPNRRRDARLAMASMQSWVDITKLRCAHAMRDRKTLRSVAQRCITNGDWNQKLWGRLFIALLPLVNSRKLAPRQFQDIVNDVQVVLAEMDQADPPATPWLALIAGEEIAVRSPRAAEAILRSAHQKATALGKFFVIASVCERLSNCYCRVRRQDDGEQMLRRALNAYARCGLLMLEPFTRRLFSAASKLWGQNSAADVFLRSAHLLQSREDLVFSRMCGWHAGTRGCRSDEIFENFVRDWVPGRYVGRYRHVEAGRETADALIIHDGKATAVQAKHVATPRAHIPKRLYLRSLAEKYGVVIERYVFVVTTSQAKGWRESLWHAQYSYGRDASHEAPPVQIRASGVTAHGSCLG